MRFRLSPAQGFPDMLFLQVGNISQTMRKNVLNRKRDMCRNARIRILTSISLPSVGEMWILSSYVVVCRLCEVCAKIIKTINYRVSHAPIKNAYGQNGLYAIHCMFKTTKKHTRACILLYCTNTCTITLSYMPSSSLASSSLSLLSLGPLPIPHHTYILCSQQTHHTCSRTVLSA